jgi:hypothetical protein
MMGGKQIATVCALLFLFAAIFSFNPAQALSLADQQVLAEWGVLPWNSLGDLPPSLHNWGVANCPIASASFNAASAAACAISGLGIGIDSYLGKNESLWFREDLGLDSTGALPTGNLVIPPPYGALAPRCALVNISGKAFIRCALLSAPQIPATSPLPSAKNLGGSSNPDCPTGLCEGNPINAATGNKFQVESDYAADPHTQLSLARFYNSRDLTSGGYGTGWHDNWRCGITASTESAVSAYVTVTVTRADGRQDVFAPNGTGGYVANRDVTSVLSAVVNPSKVQTGWQLVTADDTVENYTLAGLLSTVTTRAGLVTTLTYDANNRLIKVTGPFGHTLTFIYPPKALPRCCTSSLSRPLAYALPYRRFAVILADANARLGADAVCYSFIVVNLHHLLFAGFYKTSPLIFKGFLVA